MRTEFFAIGFRNPWQMSFDPVTGLLYCGDVGAATTEEVDIVVRGGNYGWPYIQGHALTSWTAQAPPEFESLEPILTYSYGNATNQGRAIIGGIVYRGNNISQLEGQYLFADYALGHVWAARYDGTNNPASFDWLTSDPGISAFGRDPRNGDVLVLNFHHGRIQRLMYVAPEEADSFPQALAETGAFADLSSLTPNPGILPYGINVPFWSDNAIKSRWFAVPNLEDKIDFNPTGNWTFPNGTVWIKHFELEMTNGIPESRRRIETRFIVKNPGGSYGVTYRWGDEQTNANLVGAAGRDETFTIHDGETNRSQVWRYPSRTECMSCHSAAAGHALGFNTWQLNCDNGNGGANSNQVARLNNLNYFSSAVSNLNDLPALDATNNHYSIGFRARSYLAANCAQCHQPGGSFTSTAQWDGRITTRLNDTKLLPSLIRPNDPNQSRLLSRISGPIITRMPPIGSTIHDTNGIALIREWVESFPPAPWKNQDVGQAAREGDSAVESGFQLSGSSTGIGDHADEFHFLYRTLTGNGHFIARVANHSGLLSPGQAGIHFRESVSAGSKNATLLFQADSNVSFQHRTAVNGETIAMSDGVDSETQWLKLSRQGDLFVASHSVDGTNWNELAQQTLSMNNELLAGMAVSSGNNAALNLFEFNHVSLMSFQISVGDGEFIAPAEVPILPQIVTSGNSVERIEFFAGDEQIGETTQELFAWSWTNAPSGSHEIRARVFDSTGAFVWSGPVQVTVLAPVELWKRLQFTTAQLADPDISGDTADPDSDGIPNLLEYAFGLPPLLANSDSLLTAELSEGFIQITFRRAKDVTDVLIAIEVSDDLIEWLPAGSSLEQSEIIGAEMIAVRSRLPIGPEKHQFMRLRVQRAE